MAIYKIFAEKDASLYTEDVEMNTGLDSILEFSSYSKLGNPFISRTLIQFPSDEISNTITNIISGSSYKAFLKLYQANLEGLDENIEIEILAASGSWSMGTGQYLDSPITKNGTSWKYRTNSGSISWATSSFSFGSTGSFGLYSGGGTWYTNPNFRSTKSVLFYSSNDIDVDVTNIVQAWDNNTILNDGFIIKQTNDVSLENVNTSNNHILKYFSRDTNTIYPPLLEFRWDDQIIETGSLQELNTLNSLISIYNNQSTYYSGSVARFKIGATPRYPVRVYQTSSIYSQNYFLPTSSQYAIKDSKTNEFVINFDENYTKLSVNNEGSYFNVYMNGLEPQRYYTILIKTTISGSTKIFDENLNFKVV